MKLGYVSLSGRGENDRALADLALRLQQRGLCVAGTVQINSGCPADEKCDMDLQVLPQGPLFRISQSLGAEAQGCRLDPHALEQAVVAVQDRMAGADLLLLNKFGKHEAEGRGFRELIAAAMAQGLPVLLGVSPLNRAAFDSFAADLGTALPPTEAAVLDWLDQPEPSLAP